MTACGPLCALLGSRASLPYRRVQAEFGPLFPPSQKTIIGVPSEAGSLGRGGAAE